MCDCHGRGEFGQESRQRLCGIAIVIDHENPFGREFPKRLGFAWADPTSHQYRQVHDELAAGAKTRTSGFDTPSVKGDPPRVGARLQS